MDPQVGFTKGFRDRVSKLDKQVQAEIWDAATKVLLGYGAVEVHKLEGADYVAFGVNRDALRVICLREEGVLLLLHVDAHDRAYAWASRNRVRRVGKVVRVVPFGVEVDDVVPQRDRGMVLAEGPLAHIRDRLFRHLDVSPGLAEVLRRVPDEDALVDLATHLTPQPLADALVDLAVDPDGLDQVVLRYRNGMAEWRTGRRDQASLAEALADPLNAGTIVMLPPGERALQTALRADLMDWRLFLHPSQQRMVRWKGKGALKLTGGPGTGKSVVAVHRARYLAEERLADDPRPVLVTTFGATLAEQLQDMVQQLCADRPQIADRIEVLTLTGVAQRLLRAGNRPATLLTGELTACWTEAMRHDQRGWRRAEYIAERTHVVCRNGAWTETQYCKTRRRGRNTRLDRYGRRQVWTVLAAFEAELARLGGGDAAALARDATVALGTGAVPHPWSAVVCDEVQDASAVDLRLLAAIARDPATGRTRSDALFLCGDGYQRLYRSGVPLSHCGIDVRGRSRRLRLNYRTTEGIRRAAVEVVQGVSVDDLDAVADDDLPALHGYRSIRGGPLPTVRVFSTAGAEADWIAELSREDGPLLVLTRTRAYRDGLCERLRDRGIEPFKLDGRGDIADQGVTLCTLHRSKGLEAPRVVIAGRQLIPLRWPGGDQTDRAQWQRQERCLLYVGMTRARDWCGLSSVG